MPCHLAGGFCFGNNGLEIIPFPIPKQVLKIAGKPELNAIFRLPGVGFKVVGEGLDDFGFHGIWFFYPQMGADQFIAGERSDLPWAKVGERAIVGMELQDVC